LEDLQADGKLVVAGWNQLGGSHPHEHLPFAALAEADRVVARSG
jgi:hypothetical protein